MITVGMITSATKNTREHPGAADNYRPLAETIAGWARMGFSKMDGQAYRHACRQSAQAMILEELCTTGDTESVVESRIDKRDLWQFTRLPIAAEYGIVPRGKQPKYACPSCEEGTILHGELCPECGCNIWTE